MSYFKSKEGSLESSINEVSKHLKDNAYSQFFKKELQKTLKKTDPTNRFFTDKSDRETLRTQPTGDEGQFLDKEGKPEPKKLKPATRRKSTATPPAFATRTGESGGPLPVSMRNRRVPKTSSLSTPVTTTPTFKSFQDRVKTVTPEVVGGETKKSAQLTKTPKEGPVIDTTASQVFDNVKGGVTKGLLPATQRQKQQEPQSQGTKQLPPSSTPNPYDLLNFPEFEKKRKTTTAGIDKTKQFKAPPIPKKSLQRTPPPTETETETQTETGGGTGGTGG